LSVPRASPQISDDEYAALYGASLEDIRKVTAFVESSHLTVKDVSAARRTITVSGTVRHFSKAFAVELSSYEHEIRKRRDEEPRKEKYRGRDGSIYVPVDLVHVLIGVFGLDNRNITKRNAAGDPPDTNILAVQEVASLYDFPTNSASGQTIAIFSESGYLLSDIQASFSNHPPVLIDVPVTAVNGGFPESETTMDICVSGKAAPGAEIAVYFTHGTQPGWLQLVGQVALPLPGEPRPSVLSISWYVADGDDATGLAVNGATTGWVTALSLAFQDAANRNVTVCVASGDRGSESKVGDGIAHVQYPASDPWVLSVGGTTVSVQFAKWKILFSRLGTS
jgi:kumamolisin